MCDFTKPKKNLEELADIARRSRIDILVSLACAKSGHIGGSLSVIDLITALYANYMRVDPENKNWADRDRLLLSKGHGAPALYVALQRLGFFSREHLWTLRSLGSILQGHPDMHKTPGIEYSSGSLGMGLSIANGCAYAARLDKKNDVRVYAVLSDGENQEGMTWEAVMTGAHHRLDNLTALVDYNKYQIDGKVDDIKTISPLICKWKAFGWHAIEIDGHNFEEICNAIDESHSVKGLPTVIIAHTVKGYGVKLFADSPLKYHGVAPKPHELLIALHELECDLSEDQVLIDPVLSVLKRIDLETLSMEEVRTSFVRLFEGVQLTNGQNEILEPIRKTIRNL